jgi:hypothetical protein
MRYMLSVPGVAVLKFRRVKKDIDRFLSPT